jgi:hypothetical protein
MKLAVYIVSLLGLFGVLGCEEEHEHHHDHPYGGAYDGTYHGYGYGNPQYPANQGYWDSHGYWHHY